jgi:hypothetical protein
MPLQRLASGHLRTRLGLLDVVVVDVPDATMN